METRLEIQLTFFVIIIAFYILENILVGNFMALDEQNKGEILLPKIVKKVLFPLFYIKRFALGILIYQIFNCCVFIVMMLIGVFCNNCIIENSLKVYLNFQKYYWWISVCLLGGYYQVIIIGLSLKRRKLRKNKEDIVFNNLRDMDTEIFDLNGDTVITTKPSAFIRGYIFIMVGIGDYSIPDIEFNEIIEELIKLNYILIYIKRYPSEDIDKTVLTIKESIKFINDIHDCVKTPVYLIGREDVGICEMMLLYNKYKEIEGMIWVCFSKEKRIKKSYNKILKKGLGIDFNNIEKDIFILSIYKKYSKEKMINWLSSR